MITQACTTINAIRNPSVIQEIISSDKGSEYLTGEKDSSEINHVFIYFYTSSPAVTEIYKVACRIKQAMLCYCEFSLLFYSPPNFLLIYSSAASNQKLSDLMLEIESSWGTLTVFIASTHVMVSRINPPFPSHFIPFPSHFSPLLPLSASTKQR